MVEAGSNLGLGSIHVKTVIEPTPPPPPPPPKILGPFATMIKFSGFDGSKLRKESIASTRGIISAIIFIVFASCLMVETIILMGIESKPFTLGWAESNIYSFMSAQSFISAICLFSWTREKFLSQFEDTLARIRGLRLSTSQTIDDYTKFHRKAALLIIPIFGVILTNSFYTSISNKHFRDDNTTFFSTSSIFLVAPIIDLIGCVATSLAIITYVTVNVALNREIKHFNKELTNSARFQQLTLPQVLNTYSKRHSDILQLIRFSNKHTSKYATIVPFFTLVTVINSFYIIGSFKPILDSFEYILFIGWVFVSMGITISSFLPLVKIQENIVDTSEILMHDDVLQTCGDDQMHHTYRVTLDRCIHSNTKIAFLSAFNIDSVVFNRIMFLVPNIAELLIILNQPH
ncbi:unnamed protein product [Caenorhabditis bovis]|uniref:Uncharacterized protein n=1 Tax=Caenorhabditis bovis TaxID=2654633 RepID=A0A8S1EE08_9PELO|nr:unnamed protein product [Caenorhabditis bovis]